MSLATFFIDLIATFLEVGKTLIPLIALFVIFDVFFLKLPKSYLRKIVLGMIMTLFGLTFFLHGVYIAFSPIAVALGEVFAKMNNMGLLFPIGLFLGVLVTAAEPSLRVLADQVETASSGTIRGKMLITTASLGVGSLIGFALWFVGKGIPLTWIILPGHLLALIGMRFTNRTFTGIAYDAGAVATGPLTVSFMMTLSLSIAKNAHEAALNGFGLVAIVALAAILAVELLGIVYTMKLKQNENEVEVSEPSGESYVGEKL